MAAGLVDQESWGGGGKIWQRGGPSGGGGSKGGGSGGGVGGGGGGGGVNGSGGGVDGGGGRPVSATCELTSGWGRAEMMDLCRHSKYFGDIWLLFGVLFSVYVFVGIPKIDEYLAFYSCYKLKKQIHK